jgi:hypothetical protein
MTAQDFHKQLNELLDRAANPADPKQVLPMFAIVGIMTCTANDLQIRSYRQMEMQAAHQQAVRMAKEATDNNKGN